MSHPHQDVLVRSRPRTSILDFQLGQILAFLREKLADRGVEQAYLFGSLASGAVHAWSDVDLVLVQETQLPFIERPRAFWDLLELGVTMDILVYTHAELDRLRGSDSGFWKEFERNHVRVL